MLCYSVSANSMMAANVFITTILVLYPFSQLVAPGREGHRELDELDRHVRSRARTRFTLGPVKGCCIVATMNFYRYHTTTF